MKKCLYVAVMLQACFIHGRVAAGLDETLPQYSNDNVPRSFEAMWEGFDPRAEPLEVETLKEWEEDDVVLRIVRFRIGIFKGRKSMLAAIYGFPKNGTRLPGLLQIHGGGQYADYRAPMLNARRGYATVSIAWAGRIAAPGYQVNKDGVQLFWDAKTQDPHYKLTTDWGAVDGYHAPSRNPKNVFPQARPATWTLDAVESPRNSSWFLCALAARRALTFLEQQPEVDANRLGVYGHSMGGKLTVMTVAADDRVKAAAPSCGGISDRTNESPLFRAGIGDDANLKHVSCPIIFLSPSNDFHGRIEDLPTALDEIRSQGWRVTCSAHHNHQDTAEFQVAGPLWFDQHLKGTFQFPETPATSWKVNACDGVPRLSVIPDATRPLQSVDVYYTQNGRLAEDQYDRVKTITRFWHHATAQQDGERWTASLPLSSIDKPLWVYANVLYALDQPLTGAGYYYGPYTAETVNVSSVMQTISAQQLAQAGAQATAHPTRVIESFEGDWEKEWFTYKPEQWSRTTHKLHDDLWKAPRNASLAIDVLAAESNAFVVRIDDHVAEVQLAGGGTWQEIVLKRDDFRNLQGHALPDWENVKQLKLSAAERLMPRRGDTTASRIVGKNWRGANPRFRNLRWQGDDDGSSFVGNWAMRMHDGSSGWLSIGKANKQWTGELWRVGQTKAITDMHFDDGKLTFTRQCRVGAPEFEGGPPTGKRVPCIFEATVAGETIRVAMQTVAGQPPQAITHHGRRLPPLPPKPDLSSVEFGQPVELFNGRDLTGWQLANPKQLNGWKAIDGELVNESPKATFEPYSRYGNLRTIQEFGDSKLNIEFNVPPAGNSGIYVRGAYEAQVVDRDSRMQGIQGVGAIFNRIAPTKNAGKPGGEWQSYEITIVDRHATVVLNGEKVIDNQPILGNTNGAFQADVTVPGPLYLQGDHTAVRYRNIVIRPVIERN